MWQNISQYWCSRVETIVYVFFYKHNLKLLKVITHFLLNVSAVHRDFIITYYPIIWFFNNNNYNNALKYLL